MPDIIVLDKIDLGLSKIILKAYKPLNGYFEQKKYPYKKFYFEFKEEDFDEVDNFYKTIIQLERDYLYRIYSNNVLIQENYNYSSNKTELEEIIIYDLEKVAEFIGEGNFSIGPIEGINHYYLDIQAPSIEPFPIPAGSGSAVSLISTSSPSVRYCTFIVGVSSEFSNSLFLGNYVNKININRNQFTIQMPEPSNVTNIENLTGGTNYNHKSASVSNTATNYTIRLTGQFPSLKTHKPVTLNNVYNILNSKNLYYENWDNFTGQGYGKANLNVASVFGFYNINLGVTKGVNLTFNRNCTNGFGILVSNLPFPANLVFNGYGQNAGAFYENGIVAKEPGIGGGAQFGLKKILQILKHKKVEIQTITHLLMDFQAKLLYEKEIIQHRLQTYQNEFNIKSYLFNFNIKEAYI